MSLSTMKARNPRNGKLDYTFNVDSADAIAAKAQTMRRYAPAWAKLSIGERVTALTQWRDALAKRKTEIIAALTIDTGRMRETTMEFDATISGINRWLTRAPLVLGAPPPTRASIVVPMLLHPASTPIGLVGVISPWNFPLLLALIDAIPALLAGCPVIIKPSEFTPRFVAPMQAALDECPVLRQALSLVAGGPAVGAAIIDQADAVCFTGSVPTGKIIAKHCAERLIPCFLELGGKDAALVLHGANITHAARAICWGGLANAGQSCLSVERIFVEDALFSDFAKALTDEVKKLSINYPDISQGQIGPLIAERQAAVIQSQLDDAYAQGATATVGGKVEEHDGGLWCPPTVLINVSPQMRIMTEETFGPVLPVMACRDAAHALELANGTEFGLSGAVFGDAEQAREVALQMECGAVSINDAALTAIVHDGEKQAFKQSGVGVSRMGDASIGRFRRSRVLIENPTQQANPWWF
jgi:succinate-semialdehyde dehydrogenase / glutarate-semialdehyde dehydrogenase